MLLQFCDKCGRPLSEGCIARGEAVKRGDEVVCAHCISGEQTDAAMKAASDDTTGPLGHYEQSVWSCDTCGIPVTALDLIEGRAARGGGIIKCSRCAPILQETSAPKPQAKPARPTPPARVVKPAIKPAAHRPAASTPRHASAAAENYVAEARSEQRRPILPIVLFAIVFAGFAASMYFAITSQQKLEEVMNARAKDADDQTDRRNSRPHDVLKPDGNEPPDNLTNSPPAADGGEQTEPEGDPPASVSDDPEPIPLPPEVLGDLVGIEKDLAMPVIQQLTSAKYSDVWEGLITAGSRRLIATRPYVRALLRDQDDQTRAIACRVCAMLNDKEALPLLTKMIEQDPATAVQTEARKARDRMTGQATREVKDLTDEELREMLEDLQRELEKRNGSND